VIKRKKYNNKRWLQKQLLKQIEKKRFLKGIFIWECSQFFRSYDKAKSNQKLYKREYYKCEKKIKYYQELLEKLKYKRYMDPNKIKKFAVLTILLMSTICFSQRVTTLKSPTATRDDPKSITDSQIDSDIYYKKLYTLVTEIYKMQKEDLVQGEATLKETEQFNSILGQIIEADHQLAMNLPSKLMNVLPTGTNVFWGSDSTGRWLIERDSANLKYNIIICDTCTGAGLNSQYNLILDYNNKWMDNLTQEEIVGLMECEAMLALYWDTVQVRQLVFDRVYGFLHIGIARESNLYYAR